MNKNNEKEKIQQQNEDGTYSTAIPKPYYTNFLLFFTRCKCDCGKKFKSREEYRNHYKKEHIDNDHA